MVGGLQGEEWNFIQKYLKKNIPKCRSQISGCFRNHFARENGVCEISQTLKRAAKSFRNNKLNSQGCEVWLSSCGVWLPSRRETSREIQSTVQKGYEIIPQQKGDFATLC